MLNINGKNYKEAAIDFNAICELDDMGIKMFELKKVNALKLARGYFALCMGGAQMEEIAGNEINQHIINGGNLESITEAFSKAVEESGFFQALKKNSEKGNAEGKEQ